MVGNQLHHQQLGVWVTLQIHLNEEFTPPKTRDSEETHLKVMDYREAKAKKTLDDDDGGDDRISALPDGLLCHILSFLHTSQAVATAILSTRWKYLFTSLPDFDVDDSLLLCPGDRIDAHPSLKRLEFCGYGGDYQIVLNAPVLEYLEVSDCVAGGYLVKDLKSLVTARLSVGLTENQKGGDSLRYGS
ncbi:hypothetical protein RHGRI_019650 [Rhododendron griersonianum]|uniref:F-box domain-containing protein n=1 Tax=Rhododendron griersonianum TaxID=479676 RepID=A0AAV6JDA1_9ERIC|nr:hypothetical protein RHGRI_019650 [Rhododendron griersonianum]